MGSIPKIILTLIIAAIIPSTLAAVNGKCTGRDGICISANTCSSYHGQTFSGKCPADPNGILCCDNIPCTANDGRTGKCVFSSQCSGDAISGKCPGGSDFKWCVPKEPTGTACSYEGLNGVCKNVNSCTGFTVSGRCAGGNDIKCCLPKNSCYSGKGVCLPSDQCASGNTISNQCSGSSNIKCCLPESNPTPSVSGSPKYFTIAELVHSSTAIKQGIDNTPTQDIKNKLLSLIVNCLDPIREIYGKPITVTSGYRCEKLNTAVGGATNSQHKKGEAADLVPASGGSLKDLYKAIIKFGNYDQLIFENKSWAHVSYTSNPRHQILYYNGKTYLDITNNYEKYLWNSR